ncbi:MAG: hypothetical protein OIF48_16285 [Silicimonas sp.]|nr:hypothetical protein [Silicimonas sp.]
MRAALISALLLPYLVLQSISAGVMPVAGPDGLSLMICTGDAVVDRALPTDEAPAPHETGEACPWAVAHVAAVLDAAPDLAWQDVPARRVTRLSLSEFSLPEGPRPNPPARAPPSLT